MTGFLSLVISLLLSLILAFINMFLFPLYLLPMFFVWIVVASLAGISSIGAILITRRESARRQLAQAVFGVVVTTVFSIFLIPQCWVQGWRLVSCSLPYVPLDNVLFTLIPLILLSAAGAFTGGKMADLYLRSSDSQIPAPKLGVQN